ncbi:hypothetical protein evm_004239 [Chilo suppressalis]|nr:hypothetical protein evm_004239 [Chilo suppressalis]
MGSVRNYLKNQFKGPDRGHWIIYLTNWGVLIILVTTGLAVAVSARAYFKGPIVLIFGLPWYLKLFWAAYNVGITVAFLITVFYYSFLYNLAQDNVDPTIDLLTHGINTVVMFLLLITSMHPSHLFHCVYPIAVLLLYAAFNIIYYFAGGVSHTGDPYIYPMLDWSKPGLATGVLIGCLGAAIVLHILVVLISLLRDFLSKKYVRDYNTLEITT